jgi:hypothetical protein
VALAPAGSVVGQHLSPVPLEVVVLDSGTPPTGVLTITSDGTDVVRLKGMVINDPALVVNGFPPLPAGLAPGTTLTIRSPTRARPRSSTRCTWTSTTTPPRARSGSSSERRPWG